MNDNSGKIFNLIYNTLREEAEANGGPLYGFRVYDEVPRRDPLFYPCIVLVREEEVIMEEYFGGGRMKELHLGVQLAVMQKTAVEDDTELYETDKLVMYYRDVLEKILESMDPPADVNMGNTRLSYNMRIPGTDSPIFGVEVSVITEYYED